MLQVENGPGAQFQPRPEHWVTKYARVSRSEPIPQNVAIDKRPKPRNTAGTQSTSSRLPKADGPPSPERRRRPRRGRRHKQVVLLVDWRQFHQHQPPLALCLDRRHVQHGWKRTAQEVGAEMTGPATQFLLVNCVLLAFGDRDFDGVVISGWADADVLEGGAERAEHGVRLVERGPHLSS